MHLAIKLPDDLRKRVCSFPFLQNLVKGMRRQIEKANEGLEEEEKDTLFVHLIALKKDIEVLNLLPFQAFYHELEEEDLKTVFTAHRAFKALMLDGKIDRIDTYLTLTESFVDASIGKSIGAHIKAGFGLGKNKFFLDRKASLLKGRHYCEQYHELSRLFLEDVPDVPPKGFSRELDPMREDWSENPYYLVNLSAKNGEIEAHWEEFFSFIEGESFVLVCDSLDLNTQKESLSAFVQKLSQKPGNKNSYEVFELENLIEFGKLATYAQTFITQDSPLMHIAAYCGGHVHFLGEKEPMLTSGPIYFLGEVRYFNLKEPVYREGQSIAYHKVFDEILKFIDTKKKEKASSD